MRAISPTTWTGSPREGVISYAGVGIAEEDLHHIFDRFWRADKMRSRGTGGAGLGLAIARWIIDRHQGEIEVRSQPNRGTTFTVRIPTCSHSPRSASVP
ncbi:MAG: hypothetical protein DMG13_14385 [Acidobacteria bacterium]|nr:MAG: hypothetical protein DMG13_14385 [Acidobacteriota bacterium]